MKIEDRVIEAMQAGIDRNFIKGMALICPAIEATARKKLGKRKITKDEFKLFLRSNYLIIEAFIGAGLNFDETVFPGICLLTDSGRKIGDPDFADIVYHAFRCSLAHGHELGDEFTFTSSTSQGFSEWLIHVGEGRIHMPDKVLWALISCVVFCNANSDIVTDTDFFLTWGGGPAEREPPYRFDLDIFWGGECLVQKFLKSRNIIRVAMRF